MIFIRINAFIFIFSDINHFLLIKSYIYSFASKKSSSDHFLRFFQNLKRNGALQSFIT